MSKTKIYQMTLMFTIPMIQNTLHHPKNHIHKLLDTHWNTILNFLTVTVTLMTANNLVVVQGVVDNTIQTEIVVIVVHKMMTQETDQEVVIEEAIFQEDGHLIPVMSAKIHVTIGID